MIRAFVVMTAMLVLGACAGGHISQENCDKAENAIVSAQGALTTAEAMASQVNLNAEHQAWANAGVVAAETSLAAAKALKGSVCPVLAIPAMTPAP